MDGSIGLYMSMVCLDWMSLTMNSNLACLFLILVVSSFPDVPKEVLVEDFGIGVEELIMLSCFVDDKILLSEDFVPIPVDEYMEELLLTSHLCHVYSALKLELNCLSLNMNDLSLLIVFYCLEKFCLILLDLSSMMYPPLPSYNLKIGC